MEFATLLALMFLIDICFIYGLLIVVDMMKYQIASI
jgi:hypothetical protein